MKKVSLRKEITSILDNATLKNGLHITEVTNEQGFKCVYRFPKNMRDLLLKRASKPKRTPVTNAGESTQKRLALLQKNREAIQPLFDISYLMKTYGYDDHMACDVLFKDKKELPTGFYKTYVSVGYERKVKYYFRENRVEYSIKSLVALLPLLPKAWTQTIKED